MLYQHEKNILSELAERYERKARHCQVKSTVPGMNKKMYLKQMETELEKAKILRKAVNL